MEALFNAFLAIGLLVVIVLIIYLVDRINNLERETRRVSESMSTTAMSANQGPFGGLFGKKLWDALSGKAPPGTGEQTVQEWRELYEVVLHKHIQSLFEEGRKDAQRGLSGDPKNSRMIRTAQATVDAWMPAAQANTIYKCGMDSVLQPPEAWDPVRSALDEAGQLLFGRIQLPLKEPLSRSLLPAPVQGALPMADAGAADAPQTRTETN